MDCSTPDFPVLHYLPWFAQTRVHWVNDAIQLSHPLKPPSPPALNLSWHQGLFSSSSDGQSIGASASVSVLPVNIQGWFPFGLTGFISLQSQGISRIFCSTTVQKHELFSAQPSLCSTLTSVHDYWKNLGFDSMIFVSKVMPLLFNTLSRFVFSSKEQAPFNFMAAVTVHSDFGAQENKICHYFYVFPICSPWSVILNIINE